MTASPGRSPVRTGRGLARLLDQLCLASNQQNQSKLRTALQEQVVSRARLDEVIEIAGQAYGLTPFHVAFRQADHGLMSLLAELGADVNEAGPEGEPAIVTAARSGDAATCMLLVSLGVHPGQSTANGTTALRAAAEGGHTELFDTIAIAHKVNNDALIQQARGAFTESADVEPTSPVSPETVARDGESLVDEFLEHICEYLKETKLRATDLVKGPGTNGDDVTAPGLKRILETVGMALTQPEKRRLVRTITGASGSCIKVPQLLDAIRVQRRMSGRQISRTPSKPNTLVGGTSRRVSSAKKDRLVSPRRSQQAHSPGRTHAAKSPSRTSAAKSPTRRTKTAFKILPRQPDTTRKQTRGGARITSDVQMDSSARPATPPRRQLSWYYASDSLTTVREGPVTYDVICKLLDDGKLQPQTALVWRSGMKVWSTISSCADFSPATKPAKNPAKLSKQPISLKQPRVESQARSTPPQRSRGKDVRPQRQKLSAQAQQLQTDSRSRSDYSLHAPDTHAAKPESDLDLEAVDGTGAQPAAGSEPDATFSGEKSVRRTLLLEAAASAEQAEMEITALEDALDASARVVPDIAPESEQRRTKKTVRKAATPRQSRRAAPAAYAEPTPHIQRQNIKDMLSSMELEHFPTATVMETEPQMEPNSEPKQESKPKPELEPGKEPEPEPESESKPESESEPEKSPRLPSDSEAESEAESELEPRPEPGSQLQPQLESEMEPEPEPKAPQDAEKQVLAVVFPEDARPGDSVAFEWQNRELSIEVPEGVVPGSEVEVQIEVEPEDEHSLATTKLELVDESRAPSEFEHMDHNQDGTLDYAEVHGEVKTEVEPEDEQSLATATLELVGREKVLFEFDQMDSNQDGTLDYEEVRGAVSKLFPNGDHDAALDYAYQAADGDHDGVIDPAEFLVLTRHLVYLNNLWKLLDATNGDGARSIDLEEFMLGCKIVDLEIDRNEAEAEFDSILDSGGHATVDAFCIWCSKRNAQVSAAKRIQATVRGRSVRCSRSHFASPERDEGGIAAGRTLSDGTSPAESRHKPAQTPLPESSQRSDDLLIGEAGVNVDAPVDSACGMVVRDEDEAARDAPTAVAGAVAGTTIHAAGAAGAAGATVQTAQTATAGRVKRKKTGAAGCCGAKPVKQ